MDIEELFDKLDKHQFASDEEIRSLFNDNNKDDGGSIAEVELQCDYNPVRKPGTTGKDGPET